MSGTPIDTLFMAYEDAQSACALEGQAVRTYFWGAVAHPNLMRMSEVRAYQPGKLLADSFRASNGMKEGMLLEDERCGDICTAALVNVPKQSDEAKGALAHAVMSLAEGGVLVASAANDANGGRLTAWFKELGLAPASVSKHKARGVWAVRTDALRMDVVQEWIQKSDYKMISFGDGLNLWSKPGIFSWDRPDQGSKLLAEYITTKISGTGYDLGSGNGYLSLNLLQGEGNSVSCLTLVEMDARSVECARRNLENKYDGVHVDVLWADVLSLPHTSAPADFVVMNPPFHTAKKEDMELGQGFLKTAARLLKKGGTLWMVANVHLPYEALLNELFAQVVTHTVKNGFKIIEAVK